MPDLFNASERKVQDFAQEKKLDATFIKELIQQHYCHPEFDPDDADHNMNERLMGALEEGNLEVIDLKEDDDWGTRRQVVQVTSRQDAAGAACRPKVGLVPARCLQGAQGRNRGLNRWALRAMQMAQSPFKLPDEGSS